MRAAGVLSMLIAVLFLVNAYGGDSPPTTTTQPPTTTTTTPPTTTTQPPTTTTTTPPTTTTQPPTTTTTTPPTTTTQPPTTTTTTPPTTTTQPPTTTTTTPPTTTTQPPTTTTTTPPTTTTQPPTTTTTTPPTTTTQPPTTTTTTAVDAKAEEYLNLLRRRVARYDAKYLFNIYSDDDLVFLARDFCSDWAQGVTLEEFYGTAEDVAYWVTEPTEIAVISEGGLGIEYSTAIDVWCPQYQSAFDAFVDDIIRIVRRRG